MKRLQNTPLYISAKRALMDYLRKENMGGKKLPSEEVLAQYLGVGKTTVREAMASLLQNGVITKRRGRDSIAVESALSASMRFDLFVDFVDMLVDAGYSIVLRQTPIKSVILEDCDEDTGSTGLEFKYYYMVDDRAAIISRIRIPDRVIVKPPPPQAVFRNVTDLFYSCTKETINHSLAFFYSRNL
jgi:GntR family transcriptional regulator